MTTQTTTSGMPPARPSRVTTTIRNVAGFLRQMAQRPLAFAGMLIVFLFLGLAVVGPNIAPYEFDDILRGEDRRALRDQPPSTEFLMGTDRSGRDVFSRVLTGARDTIGLPAIATILAVMLGTVVGLATGYLGGLFDEVISRALDSLLAIPALILALVMLTTITPVLSTTELPILRQLVDAFGANNISIVLVIVLLYVPIVSRVIRSATLNVRDSGYVEAARLRGESTRYVLFSEILPSVLPALVVEASLRFSYAIFLVASLGFLGLGVQPPSPEWGRMVLDAREQIANAPWSLWFPVAAIAILVISVNLMSDGLRRVFRYE